MKSVFNFAANFNGFERQFAELPDAVDDVECFPASGVTEQETAGIQLRSTI